MTTGVLLMAHGTPGSTREIAPFYTRIRRGRPPTPSNSPSWRPRHGDRRHLTAHRPHRGTGGRPCAPPSMHGRRGDSWSPFGAKHTTRSLRSPPPGSGRPGWSGSWAWSSRPTALRWARRSIWNAPRAALGTHAGCAVAPWYAHPALVDAPHHPRAGRTAAEWDRPDEGGSSPPRADFPERIRESRRPYPDQLAESSRLVAGSRPGSTSGSLAWQSAGRTPEPWLGPRRPRRRAPACRRRHHRRRRRSARSGSSPTTSRCSTTSMSSWPGARGGEARSLGYARTASLNDDPSFIVVLTDLIMATDEPRPDVAATTGWSSSAEASVVSKRRGSSPEEDVQHVRKRPRSPCSRRRPASAVRSRARTFGGRTVDLGPDGFLGRRPEAPRPVPRGGDHRRAGAPSPPEGASVWARESLRECPRGRYSGLPTRLWPTARSRHRGGPGRSSTSLGCPSSRVRMPAGRSATTPSALSSARPSSASTWSTPWSTR